MDASIVAEGLVKVFGGGRKQPVRALDGVSLQVPAGTVLGLLGPNGAGKTTAVSILTTLLRPDAGRATVAGFDVVTEAHQVRKHIGLAGQSAAVDERLTGRENLVLVGKLNHLAKVDARRRADQLLVRFGLTEAADRPALTYSGGMRRRLDLAAALVASPPIIFLDEPTTGLDPRSRSDLWAVIDELVAEGTTVLLTTQYLEEADRLAGRIIVVDGGAVIAEGSPRELKARLGSTVVELTLSQQWREIAVSVAAGLGDGPPKVVGSTLHVGLAEGAAQLPELVRRLDLAGVRLTDLVLREPTLDDVFLELTGGTRGDDRAGGPA